MDIKELIANGQRKLADLEDLAQQNKAKEEQKANQVRLALVDQFKLDVIALTPEPLRSYLVFDESDAFEPGYEEIAVVRAPDCCDIQFRMQRVYQRGEKCDYAWKLPKSPLTYLVTVPENVYMDYEIDAFCVGHETRGVADIEVALALARQAGQAEKELTEDANCRNAMLATDLASKSAQEQAANDKAKATLDAQDRERQDLLDLLTNDLVAFHLLRAFAGVQAEREAWQDKLDSANQAMEEIDASHARRIEAIEKRALAERRDAEDARARETEARDDADRAEKKLKQAQRGW